MKQLSAYIQEKLIINKDYRESKTAPKSFSELRRIIIDRYDKLGAGTKQNPIDFNDIDVSNIDSFCNKYDKGLFEGTKFKYIDISDWDVSNVESMRHMFYWCIELRSIGDISNWDVTSVTDMSHMFSYCSILVSVGDISKWNVSNVEDTSFMFERFKKFNQDISKWDISNARVIMNMFSGCPIKDEYKPKFK